MNYNAQIVEQAINDIQKAISSTDVSGLLLVREDLQAEMAIMAPTDTPLRNRFNRIAGNGETKLCHYKTSLNSVNILTSNVEDNTEPSLSKAGVETRHRRAYVFVKGKPNPFHKKSVEARKKKGGYKKPWNKGLTKHDHPSVMKYAVKQQGKNNSVFKMDDPMKFLYENGLKTRILYRGSIDNISPRNHRQFGVNQDKSMLKRCNYTCERCKITKHVKDKPLESDHIIARALGGETKIYNGQMLCHKCHVKKTRKDMTLIRKHVSQGIVRS